MLALRSRAFSSSRSRAERQAFFVNISSFINSYSTVSQSIYNTLYYSAQLTTISLYQLLKILFAHYCKVYSGKLLTPL